MNDFRDPFAPAPRIVLEGEQRANMKLWIETLESDKYSQTKHHLRVVEANDDYDPVGFCCLGVACHVYDPTKWIEDPDDGRLEAYPTVRDPDSRDDRFETAMLSHEVMAWLGAPEQDIMLTGVVRKAKHYIHYKGKNEHGVVVYKNHKPEVGTMVTQPASWWNDTQDYSFRDIAKMLRERFCIEEDQP